MTGRSDTSKPVLKFALVTTGGTIAGLKTDEKHYQSAELTGHAFAEQFGLNPSPDLECTSAKTSPVEWVVYSPYSIGSQNLSWYEMLTLRELLMELNADASIKGILVSHGTDTMEDMLFFLYLTLPALNKPILFTGSMLTFDSPGSDAPKNMSDALGFLIDTAARSQAFLGLVMNGKYTPAFQVQKRSTSGVDVFDCQNSIPIDKLLDGCGSVASPTMQFESIRSDFLGKIAIGCDRNAQRFRIDLHNQTAARLYQKFEQIEVELIFCTPNLKEGSIQKRFNNLSQTSDNTLNGVSRINIKKTLVIAAPGNGNIPSRLIPELQELISQGIRVVRASRIVQSALVEGGELTGLEPFVRSNRLLQGTPGTPGTPELQASPNPEVKDLYHEAHGLSLNQVMVLETCRLLIL